MLAEEVSHTHQVDRITRSLNQLNLAKKAHAVECDKLARLAPTSDTFDAQAASLANATKLLISARKNYLNCARSI